MQEPVIPPTCAVLTAMMAESDVGTENKQSELDTVHIQSAIDHCRPGAAVELRANGRHRAFLSGPLELKPGITLLVDSGVTLFATRNPRAYEVHPGSCGVVDDNGRGCRPLIHAENAFQAAIMGEGTIDGQGGEHLLGSGVSWWDLAHQAKITDKKQNCPRLLIVDSSNDFVLYGITFRNSPNFHVLVSKTDGFTAWAVRIDSPASARNTDGIDPSSSTNVTIAYSWIRAGDDNIAIKAGKNGPATHMTILRNHFYSGHGMSIGSETDGGVSAIRVVDLTIDGADNGIRIKSDVSRGGLVRDVAYQDICIRNVKDPIVIDPFYSKLAKGELFPQFQEISLRNVHSSGGGKLTLLGLDKDHSSKVQFAGVQVDGLKNGDLQAAHARLTFGPGAVNLRPLGEDVQVVQRDSGEKGEAPSCDGRFLPFPESHAVVLQRAASSSVATPRRSVSVAADGSGDYTSVQQAVQALGSEGGTVRIKPGIYREVIRIITPRVRLEGVDHDASKAVIVYGNSASITGSTFTSATVFVNGEDFSAANLTFRNDFSNTHELQPQGSQAVALSVTADRAIFRNVRVLGAQDTLYLASRSCQSETGPCLPTRQYFADCFVEGHVDFIFGDSRAAFDRCTIHAIAHREAMLTAQSKKYPEQDSGYVFNECRVTSDPGVDRIFLGRPWRSYATVIFLNSDLDAKIADEGWREWHPGETERLKTATYAEYKSTGPGARPERREAFSRQLKDEEAARYQPCSFLAGHDGWRPCDLDRVSSK